MSQAAIGPEIKAIREQKGISQNQLAKMAGISQSGLSAIENTTKNPSVQTIRLLCDALDISPNIFFYDADAAEEERRIKNGINDFTSQEYELIEQYRALNDTRKLLVDNFVRELHAAQEYESKKDSYGSIAAYEGGYTPPIKVSKETEDKYKK